MNDYGDEYRTKLNTKNRETRKLIKEQRIQENPDLIIKIGRPKKPISDVIPQKKANGRPRKFNLDGTLI